MLLIEKVTSQIESVREERVGGMVPCELLLKDEEVIYVVEYSMEVRRKQTRLDYLSHLGIALPV